VVKTKRYIDQSGEFRAFGFPNSLVAKGGVRDILNSIPGVEIESFSKDMFAEEFCAFRYKGRKFTVVEPFGDNSYYDIVCESPDTNELEEILQHFSAKRVPSRWAVMQWLLLGLPIAYLVYSWLIER